MTSRRKAGRRRFSAVPVVLLSIAGCATWQPMEPGDHDYPARIGVETTSLTRIELRDPVLQDDSVIVGTSVDERVPVRIPLRDVAVVVGHFGDPAGTATLICLSAVVLLIGWARSHMPYT